MGASLPPTLESSFSFFDWLFEGVAISVLVEVRAEAGSSKIDSLKSAIRSMRCWGIMCSTGISMPLMADAGLGVK